ncbi:MAG: hypothetical protein LBV12_00280 [Puniceicoccales bacterium]|jgi:hypothetical protein|nr:hypothetical protein [Puniceicoccales bacterium]
MNNHPDDIFCSTSQREKRRQILILACELDRLEWRLQRRRQSRPMARVLGALGIFEFIQPLLPKYLRYVTTGLSLAFQLFGKR